MSRVIASAVLSSVFGGMLAACPTESDVGDAPGPATPATVTTSSTALAVQRAWTERLPRLRVDRLDERWRVARSGVPIASLDTRRPLAVAFFATYCPPCLAEMPMFNALASDGHAVVGVSMDTGNLEALRPVLDGRAVRYPIGVMSSTTLKTAGRALDGLPMTLILDRFDTVTDVFLGEANRRAIIVALNRAR